MRKHGRSKIWILEILLIVGALIGMMVGFEKMDQADRKFHWNVEVSPITARAAREDELPADRDMERQYYVLEFNMNNHSGREVNLEGYMLSVEAVNGQSWAVRNVSPDGNAQYQLEPQLPSGCTGPVRLLIQVDREDMESGWVELTFDKYGSSQVLGSVNLDEI